MSNNKFDDFNLPGANERGGCNGVFVMSMQCPVCKLPIEGPAVALGKPYWCLLHAQCWPHFPFDGTYPHTHALSILAKKI